MSRPKWVSIAKNEYLLRTSSFRRYRNIYPILATFMVIWYVFFIAPNLFSAASDLTKDFFLSNAALAFMQVMLFIIFVSIITIPIMQTLQDASIAPLETLLSAPIEPKDVLIGKYLGSLPTYLIVVSVIAGTFLALFIPFGMSLEQVLISVIVFILVVLIALWIGTLVAAVLRARLGRSARGRDAGQALALLIALPMVAVMYSAMNGQMLSAVQGKGATLSTAFSYLPSSWGADIILTFLNNPGDLNADLGTTVLALGGLATFLFGSIYIGAKLSGRAYDFEPVSFSTPRAPAEGLVYRVVRSICGGGAFASVVVTVVKDYGRRLENLSRIIYILGLVGLMELFILSSLPEGNYVSVSLLTISWMMAFLCVFVVGEVTARGKDNLFVYRKAPGGETRLIKARIVQGSLVVLPTAAICALMVLIPADLAWWEVLLLTMALVAVSASYVVMSIGLFLLSPAFSERPSEMVGNAVTILSVSFFLYIISIVAFGEPWGLLALVVMSSSIGGAMLFAGSKRIRTVE